jgi:hypothetical protein
MKIYLGGAINGCTNSECNDWRNKATELMSDWEMINPMVRDYRGREDECVNEIVELDKIDINNSKALLVSYVKPSVGTSMEILYAWERQIPVFMFTDSDSISPWLKYHTTRIFKSMEDAVKYLQEIF